MNWKKILQSMAITVLAFSAKAQVAKNDHKAFKYSMAANIGFPGGDYYEIAAFAYGGDLEAEYEAGENLGVTLGVGYFKFVGRNGYTFSYGVVPILAGVRYYFADELYTSMQLGVTFGTRNATGAITFAPGIGYKVTNHFDLLLKYQAATRNSTNTDFVAVRAAFVF